MLSRLRLALQAEDGGNISGDIEVDETYIGGKSRNMHADKRKRVGMQRGRSMAGKVAVMGLLDRHGKDGVSQVRTTILKGRKSGTLQAEVRKHVAEGSNGYTDVFYSYRGLQGDFQHGFVDHAEAYVDGQIHTNSCENFWSLLKRAIQGTYVSIESFHLFRYLDERSFRFSNRKGTDAMRFALAFKGIINKRHTYTALTGSELPQTC